jgi:hypothetical protein
MKIRKAMTMGLLALATAGVVGGVAVAREHGHWQHGMWKTKVTEHVDDALDAAKVNEAQRNAVHAALDHVFATVEDGRKDHHADFEKGIALFEADTVDPAQLQAMRAEHQAMMEKTGDAIVQAVSDAHDALTAEQRKTIVVWVRNHKPGEHVMSGHGGRGAAFMKSMISSRINEALDSAKVNEAQRRTIDAERDKVFAVFEQMHNDDPTARINHVLELFAADKLDMAQVNQLRAEHMTRARLAGDTIEHALVTAHDALTPAQRKAIGDFIRANAPHHDAPEAVTNH